MAKEYQDKFLIVTSTLSDVNSYTEINIDKLIEFLQASKESGSTDIRIICNIDSDDDESFRFYGFKSVDESLTSN